MSLLPLLLVLMIAAVGAVEQNNIKQSIEVRVIVDNFAIQKWNTYVPTNTDAAIRAFVNAVFVDVNNIFAELTSSNIRLDVRIVSIELIKNEVISAETFTGSAKGMTTTTLTNFKTWALKKSFAPAVDHTMLLTGLDLVGNTGQSGEAGVAYLSGMCSVSSAFSVSEFEASGSTATTIAHELGHNLGAVHDSEGNSCDGSSNIMAAVGDTSAGKASTFRFSTCSVNSFVTSTHSCLKVTTAAALTSTTTPGELYTPDQICQMLVSPSSSFCRTLYDGTNRAYSTMCGVIWCKLPDSSCTSVKPPSGFVCGSGKRCKLGQCLASSTAPTNVNDNCPQGDTPGPISNGKTCSQLVGGFGGHCYQSYYSIGCCASCGSIRKTSNTGCEYGDKASWCATDITYPVDCFLNSDVCCNSCKQYETGIPGCEYGDKSTQCKGTQASICWDSGNRQTCCKLCNGYSG